MNPLVGVGLVEQHLGRELTDVEEIRLELALNSVFSTLELWLNRKLSPVVITEEHHRTMTPAGTYIAVYPFCGPITQFNYIRYGTTGASVVYDGNPYEITEFHGVPDIYIGYHAGDELDAPHQPLIKQIMLDAVLRGVLAGPQVQYGVVSSYSVEGTSITYASADTGGNIGKVEVADLSSVTRLRRRVVW